MPKICTICEKRGKELQPVKLEILQILMHNYANKGLLYRMRGRKCLGYLGVTLNDDRFICARCEELTRLFEDYFDAFDYMLYETSFIKPLVNWIYAHLDVIPKRLRPGNYLPNAQCEQALEGAGINFEKAKAEVKGVHMKMVREEYEGVKESS